MKKQTGSTLIQEMALEVGETFQVGEDGPDSFLCIYLGQVEDNGKTYDKIKHIEAAGTV